MFLRWLHKSWKYFWTVVLSIVLFLLVVVGGAIGIMQMKVTKNYIANRIENNFNAKYEAELRIGQLDGLIPFTFNLDDVLLTAPGRSDTARSDTLVTVDNLKASLDVASLLQNKISVSGFSVENPHVNLYRNRDGDYSLLEILRTGKDTTTTSDEIAWPSGIEIVAPQLLIQNGSIYIEDPNRNLANIQFPGPLIINEVDASMFLEITPSQRFLDIESFTANLQEVKAGNLQIFGQIYNDQRFLEFNAFTLSLGSSEVKLNGEIDGVNVFEKGIATQLRKAGYNIDLKSERLNIKEFSDIYSKTPQVDEPLDFSIEAEGIIDSLWVDNFSFGIGESSIGMNGFLKDLTNRSKLKYQLNIADIFLKKEDVELFTDTLKGQQYDLIENLNINGRLRGTVDTVDLDLSMMSPRGELTVKGGTRLKPPYTYNGTVKGTSLNVSPLFASAIDTTNLNFDVLLNGIGKELSDIYLDLKASIYDSSVNGIPIEELELQTTLIDGLLEEEYRYQSENQVVEGSGWVDFNREEPTLAFQGNASNIDISTYTASSEIPSSRLNFDYNVELKGLKADQIHGRANLDVKNSVINGDTVKNHQLYVDLNDPGLQSRSFRLTSSLFDLNITGNIVPSNIAAHVRKWKSYLATRYRDEILLKDTVSTYSSRQQGTVDPLSIDGDFHAKDLSLIKKYFSGFPDIEAQMNLNFNVRADSSRFLFSTDVRADSLRYNDWEMAKSDVQLTASFQSDKTLKEFSNIQFVTEIEKVRKGLVKLDTVKTDLSLDKDSVTFNQSIERISDNVRMDLSLHSLLSEEAFKVSVDSFFLGNDIYGWQNDRTPQLVYHSDGGLEFNNFSFKNMNEFLEIRGRLSADRSDSLSYIIRDIDLSRISGLINGRVNFGGRVNGTLQTRSLTSRPSVQGDLRVNRLTLNDRIVGNVLFNSTYEPENERFDTQLKVITDSTQYSEYLENNDDIGHDIRLDGYIETPDPDKDQEVLYDFDVDFRQIDMWVIPLIAHKVFQSMEGQATGEGYLRGNLEDFDFNADFEATNVFAKPRFLNTNYFMNGPVTFDRRDGIILDSVQVADTKGGTGVIWGSVDLNNFEPINFLDLNFNIDQLQFINNNYDPDVPFYGNLSGTGEFKLTGANTDLFLQSVEPITVTEDSRLSIPLLEETELNENSRFIQFVENFDVSRKGRISLAEEQVRETELDRSTLEQAIDELTFYERFNLDLQFNAPNNVNVELIFDPVTGEILTAQGTGQLRITLQEEEVQMFGRYNIEGGNYQFVSGEIITRRLTLEEGGTIVWEGDPDNARLDINAIYSARPDVSTLNYRGELQSGNENETDQRVPVDLVIEINGTVSSVENNYYFRLSNSLDLTSNSTLSFTINQINRDEQQKFLQATSILLSGEFIPTQSYNEATSTLSQSLTRGSTVINPLISNQVISPLLSNQINTLLNSDVSRFDIDFNLNAYNEIDLGIALRLYNDRLILRREGQITGSTESTFGDRIGDLNATYRINKGLSINAFHRQDQTLGGVTASSRTGDVTPSVDGIGLEAKVQFNTWQNLSRRIRDTFRKIFGIKDDNESDEKLASEDDKQKKSNEN